MATSKPTLGPETRVVTITPVPGGAPRVSPDPVVISRQANHAVQWNCTDPGAEWSVHFDPTDTPFAHHHYHRERHHTGPVQGAARATPYKYDVVVNGQRLDPGVVVNP